MCQEITSQQWWSHSVLFIKIWIVFKRSILFRITFFMYHMIRLTNLHIFIQIFLQLYIRDTNIVVFWQRLRKYVMRINLKILSKINIYLFKETCFIYRLSNTFIIMSKCQTWWFIVLVHWWFKHNAPFQCILHTLVYVDVLIL